ncbi:hypothetical protein FRC10_002922, partial [Ceratobasidium sp. 414]
MLSRPTLPLQQSRGQLESSMSSAFKRKSPATSEPTSEHNKRSRDSSAAPGSNTSRLSSVSIPETVLESESESTVPPSRTPQNRSLAGEGPATPTPNAPSSAPAIPTAGNDQAPAASLPPSTPPQACSETVNTTLVNPGITPLRLSSSNTDPSSIDPSNSWSRRHPNAPNKPARNERSNQAIESNKTTKIDRPEMEEIMKYELCGNVYQHDKFFKEFLESDPLVQEDVGRRIRSSVEFERTSLLGYTDGRWTISPEITGQRNERQVYAPLAEMLNIIGRAAYAKYMELFPNDQFRQSYHPFHAYHNHHALWDSPSDTGTSPDLIMAPDRARTARTHWADMELLVECKSHSDQASRNEAYLQLARYTRAT